MFAEGGELRLLDERLAAAPAHGLLCLRMLHRRSRHEPTSLRVESLTRSSAGSTGTVAGVPPSPVIKAR
jgi:hypothetical protein